MAGKIVARHKVELQVDQDGFVWVEADDAGYEAAKNFAAQSGFPTDRASPKVTRIVPSEPSGLPGWPIEKVSREELAERFAPLGETSPGLDHLVSEMEETIQNLEARLDAQDIELDALRGKEPQLAGYSAFRELVKAARELVERVDDAPSLTLEPKRQCVECGLWVDGVRAALKPFER